MTATDDAVSLSPDLELELFGPYSENTEKYQTERELVESLNNLWAEIDEGNSDPDEAAVMNHLTEELLDTEMSTLSLQESYHIASHASSTKSPLLPTIENEDIMEDLHYYSFQDIYSHDGTRTMSMWSSDSRRSMDLSIFSPMVQCNSSPPPPLHATVMSVNYDTSSTWMANSPAPYPSLSSMSSSDSRSYSSYSSSRDFPYEDGILENMDYMDIDDPDLYKTWTNNSTLGYQRRVFLNYRVLQKRRYRSRRGSLGPSYPPQTTLLKLKASSRPYLIPNRAQRHRHRLKLRRIFQECISMCRGFVFLGRR